MNKIVKGEKSEIKKDIEYFYGKYFIQNYDRFKHGDLCLKSPESVTYVDEGKYMVYNKRDNSLVEEFDKCLVRIFFEHDGDYGEKNVSREIGKVKDELHSGKDWNGFRYHDEKYYRISQSSFFSGWFSEEEISECDLVKEIIKSINFDEKEDDLEFPPLIIEV